MQMFNCNDYIFNAPLFLLLHFLTIIICFIHQVASDSFPLGTGYPCGYRREKKVSLIFLSFNLVKVQLFDFSFDLLHVGLSVH